MRIALRRGDIATACAEALVSSANDSLVGNSSPMYWRFISRANVDGAIRKLGGEQLERACLDIEPRMSNHGIRRDITRYRLGASKAHRPWSAAQLVLLSRRGRAVRYVPTGSFMLSHQTPNLGMRDSTPVETSAKRLPGSCHNSSHHRIGCSLEHLRVLWLKLHSLKRPPSAFLHLA
ncbi:MAG: hypothetical protein SGPRY_005493 [Prymnesium sp.]